jgi:hypothetical protein
MYPPPSGTGISGKTDRREALSRSRLLRSSAAVTFLGLCGGLTPAFATGYSATSATITQVLASAGAFCVYVSVAPTGGTNCCASQTAAAYRFVINPTASGSATIIATDTINFIIAH